MIKAVIFDYGGVVKESYSWWRDVEVAYKMPIERIKEKIKPFFRPFHRGTITETEFWKKAFKELKRELPQNFILQKNKDYEKSFYLFPEIINFVKQLKDKGFKTAVLSNTIESHVKIIKKHDGFKNFDVVILSCEVNLLKPEKEIYLLTVNKLGVKTQECVFVDDKKENLLPAKKLGMKTVLAKNSKQVITDVTQIIKNYKYV